MSFLTVSAIVPPATVLPFAASTAPDGWLICNGSAVSRTTYAALFASIGTSYGSGDGATTFNLPDFRWTFLRGYGPNITVTGTGTASSNQATFTAHGFNRTGVKARLSSGTLSGLALNTDYWVIVVDANTLAFAASRSNALANTRIAISGANSAIIVQSEDLDASSRVAPSVGGNSGGAVGSFQSHALQNITGKISVAGDSFNKITTPANNGAYYELTASSFRSSPGTAGSFTSDAGFDASRVAQTSTETRPTNISVNYIIKF